MTRKPRALPITIDDVPPGTVFSELIQKAYFTPCGVFLTGCRFLGEKEPVYVTYDEMIGTYKMKRPGEEWRGAWNSGPESICGVPVRLLTQESSHEST